MDFNNLNDLDVAELIEKLKYPKNSLNFNKTLETVTNLVGKINIDELVLDDDEIFYILHVYRGKYNTDRFSIHLRLKENHEHLVRVDINHPGKHINPDGSVITGNHIHIYSNKNEKKDAIAIPLPTDFFPNLTVIVDVLNHFLDYTNIESRSNK